MVLVIQLSPCVFCAKAMFTGDRQPASASWVGATRWIPLNGLTELWARQGRLEAERDGAKTITFLPELRARRIGRWPG